MRPVVEATEAVGSEHPQRLRPEIGGEKDAGEPVEVGSYDKVYTTGYS